MTATLDLTNQAAVWEAQRILKDASVFITWVQGGSDPADFEQADADASWGEEGDEEVRFCPTCERPRVGTFSDFDPGQNGGYTDPSWGPGVSWQCGQCCEGFECDIASDY